jgi:hypothetical protein
MNGLVPGSRQAGDQPTRRGLGGPILVAVDDTTRRVGRQLAADVHAPAALVSIG